jgi:hypothetical protein
MNLRSLIGGHKKTDKICGLWGPLRGHVEGAGGEVRVRGEHTHEACPSFNGRGNSRKN